MPKITVDMPEPDTGRNTVLDRMTVNATIAQIYIEQGLSVRKINKLTGVSTDCIKKVRKGLKVGSPELAIRLKEGLANKFTIAASTFMDYAHDPDKLAKAGTLQLVTAAGISVDKARLLNNESTMRITITDVYQEYSTKITQLERMLEATGEEQVPSARMIADKSADNCETIDISKASSGERK